MYSVEEETLNDGIRLGAEFAVAEGVFRLVKVLGRSLWELEPFRRGFVYEKALNLKGAFRTSDFPVIDAFYKGVATSIKTVDLRAKSYLKGNAVFNQLKRYIDQLSNFKGASWGGDVVRGSDIKSKVLEVGIPKGATPSQIEQINKAVEYGSNKNITVNIQVVK